jgi:hypothetical protein
MAILELEEKLLSKYCTYTLNGGLFKDYNPRNKDINTLAVVGYGREMF